MHLITRLRPVAINSPDLTSAVWNARLSVREMLEQEARDDAYWHTITLGTSSLCERGDAAGAITPLSSAASRSVAVSRETVDSPVHHGGI